MTAAIGAGFCGPAHAGYISTAPSGALPVSVSTTGGSFTFDLNNDGINDYTLTGGSDSIVLNGLGANAGGTFLGALVSYDSPTDFPPGSVKTSPNPIVASTSGGSPFSFFTPGIPAFGELVLDPAGAATPGYLEGTLTVSGLPGAQTADFELQDFGLVTVPEPSSLPLLAAGAAGIALFRRRRRAQAV